MLQTLFHKVKKREGMLSNFFYEASITHTAKSNKDRTKKKKFRGQFP
jgi:hypothetical protein